MTGQRQRLRDQRACATRFERTGAAQQRRACVARPPPGSARVAAAAALLRDAKQPLLAGLATDMAGARAVMRLAEGCGAVTDHMNFGAKMRNVCDQQDRGWITTTFAEVKNRADVLLIVGSDLATRFPRFFERLSRCMAMRCSPIAPRARKFS